MDLPRMTNNHGVDISLAVWLADDDYDYDPDPNVISATGLLKPVRQIVLASRIPPSAYPVDILDVLESRMGQAFHASFERSWKQSYVKALKRLGYPGGLVRSIRINPEVEEPDTLPVYTEVRTRREIAGVIVSGQVDLIIEARLRDVKSTKVWQYMNKAGVDKWTLQGSIYRWLNPDKIRHDEFLVQYLLRDWSRALVGRDPAYPAHPVVSRTFQLLSVAETEQYIRNKLQQIAQYKDAPEDQIPECPDEDLWRSSPVYKYYRNPDATGRSTKNFDSYNEAMLHMHQKGGGQGRVDTVPGEVKACNYCPAFPICTQKDRYIADGSLKPKSQ